MKPDTPDTPRDRLSARAIHLGLAANTLLAVVKTTVGIVGHSPALLADGVNSTSDVAYYIVVRIFMALSRKPADSEHPYGHRQFESIAALVVGAFVITTAIAIFWDAANNTFDLLVGRRVSEGAAFTALTVALGTVVMKFFLAAATRGLAQRTGNITVLALSYDHRNDMAASAAAAIGILLGRVGFPWADPLAGAVVALVVLFTGIKILRDSSADLMDTVPGATLNRRIVDVLTAIPGIQKVEEVRAHHFGPYLMVNVVIGVEGMLSVADGDRIATRAEQALGRNIPYLRRVYVHYHPARQPAPRITSKPTK